MSCSMAVSLDTRSVASLETLLEESIETLEDKMKKTYPAKDAASYILPYKVRDHAWNDNQQTVSNKDSYCASAPAGYTTDLKCDSVPEEDDLVNNNMTAAQKKSLEDLSKKLIGEQWQHS